jgi:hypothetical protein
MFKEPKQMILALLLLLLLCACLCTACDVLLELAAGHKQSTSNRRIDAAFDA